MPFRTLMLDDKSLKFCAESKEETITSPASLILIQSIINICITLFSNCVRISGHAKGVMIHQRVIFSLLVSRESVFSQWNVSNPFPVVVCFRERELHSEL